MRSVAATSAGRRASASRISAAICSWRVSAPTRSTRTSTGAPRLALPATAASPAALATGRDSPVSSASSTRVAPSSMRPSAGKVSPTGTRTRSPGASASIATRSTLPSAARRQAWRGAACASRSTASIARWRARASSQRPASRKATNIVSESKYTSRPNRPPGSKAAPLEATKATAMPSATGTSMPSLPARSERHAETKNGADENSSTGSVSVQAERCSNCSRSGASVPGSAT
jgi:hypothetical protein